MMNEKRIMIAFGIAFLALLIISVAFASLTTNLNVSFGNVTQNALTWNVGFKGSSVTPVQEGTSNTGLSCGAATVTASTVTISDSILSKPGDKCTYPLVISNSGDIAAKLSAIAATAPTSVNCDISGSTMICGNITYELQTKGGSILSPGVTLNKYENYNILLVVKYTGEGLNSTVVTQSNAKFTLTYIQSETRITDSGNIPEGIEIIDTLWEYDYSGKIESLKVPLTGKYQLEVWGAQGGTGTDGKSRVYEGGYGGYSTGVITLTKDTELFIVVGGAGKDSTANGSKTLTGGYNGGGKAVQRADYGGVSTSGGGATHIATASGLLSGLSSKKSKILIVAGGGGGVFADTDEVGYNAYGGSGGGYNGGYAIQHAGTCKSECSSYKYPSGGTQSSGGYGVVDWKTGGISSYSYVGTFGTGAAGNWAYGGGGGGFYGGASGDCSAGAGGSGYIGNSSLDLKEMYCFNCDENNANNLKTTKTENVSKDPISKYAKKNNGYAKITYIGN